ncbi:MAG: family 10 glycosylhydrolase [Clostridia bacterium]|nr:family 10 glycosylhydrolase [Clostridia bacterium]
MKKLLCMLLSALMLLSLAACGGSDGESSDLGEQSSVEESSEAVAVELPDVKGKTEAEALAAIAEAGYTNVKAVPCHKQGSTAGTVVAQSKTPGAVYDKDDMIIIQVSNGLTPSESAKTEIADPLLAAREELSQGANSDYKPVNYDNMKAIWLSQLDLIPVYYDYENKTQRTEDDFAAKIDTIMKNIKDSGFNTVVVQVHPDCDSMYVSKYYPWTDYINGNGNRDANQALMSENADDVTAMTYGNTSLYDLMPLMIDAAHKYELSYQAWINPMRACAIPEMEYINDSYPIKQWYNDEAKSSTYLFKTSSRIYLNPAYEEVREYITNVAVEIARYYDVDGIHMDDYFYPSADASYDKAAFEAQSDYTVLIDFRKNNINVLVKQIYDAVKAENKDMLFGISPAGNINTNMNALGADVKTWCSVAGYVDYICPQIYFGFNHVTVPFDGLSQQWIDMNTEASVDMVLGLTLHKIGKEDTYAGGGKTEWVENSDILKRSYEWIGQNLDKVDGFCMFSYQYIFDPVTGERVDYTKTEVDNFLPVMQGITWAAE